MISKDKSTPKIGIVIPIYNVAPYLRECLDSVVNQSYGNFCAVLVNDGSTDSSKQIALDFVAKDSRFVLIDKENGGLSSARNAGIQYFSGNSSNLSWGMQFRTCEKFRAFADSKSSLTPEIFHKYKSHTAITSIVDSALCAESSEKNPSLLDSAISQNLTKNNAKIAESSENKSKSAESTPDSAYKNTAPNPPQIDYIIFLDSDDFWDNDLLQICVDSAKSHNPSVIWFNYQAFYDNENRGGGGSTHSKTISSTQNNTISHTSNHTQNNNAQNYTNCINTSQHNTNQNYTLQTDKTLLDILGYKSAQTITFQSFLQNAKAHNINNFWWSWQGMIDFRMLQSINLQFFEGIIHEDHLFGGVLFAQSRQICIIPQKLYYYRIRKGSTMSAWDKDAIPSYVKPFCKHFPYQKARVYFRIYSLVISVQELLKFTKTHISKGVQNDFMAITLPLLIEIICEVFNFHKDPYHLKIQTAKIIKELGAESNILPKRVRGRYGLYMRHWKVLWVMGVLKRVERKIRRCFKK